MITTIRSQVHGRPFPLTHFDDRVYRYPRKESEKLAIRMRVPQILSLARERAAIALSTPQPSFVRREYSDFRLTYTYKSEDLPVRGVAASFVQPGLARIP